MLTTAIDSQRVMSTNVSFLEEEKDKQKVLIKALDKLELCKRLHKAFRVEETQKFTHDLLIMKKPEELLNIRSITMQGHNHSYSPSALSKIFFLKKPMTGQSPAGHYVVPPTPELRRSCICFHCQNKGHYARNCHTRKKEAHNALPVTIHTTISDNNCFKILEEEDTGHTGGPTIAPSSSLPLNTLRHPMLGSGLDQVLPLLHTPQSPKCLGAKEIQKLI